MRIGIFAKTFARSSLGETLDAVTGHGIHCIQFNYASAGLPSLPEPIDPAITHQIRREMESRHINVAAVSGTFNMIDPDPEKLRAGFRGLEAVAAACPGLGASVITLCTGTRDPENMWRRHPDNDSSAAWSDLLAAMEQAVKLAEEHRVILAFEPEVANVVDSARKARLLLDEIRSPSLKVVMDAANLFHAGELSRMAQILDEAFALVGNDIVIAHAKDLSHDGEAGHEAAGKGKLDYDRYLALLQASGFDGPLILHGLEENQVAGCVAFLRGKLEAPQHKEAV